MTTCAETLASNPANNYFGGDGVPEPSTKVMDEVRSKAAVSIGAYLNETVLMPSTTVSFNTVAQGLVSTGYLRKGDRVLTTDQEHAGGLRAWQHYLAVDSLLAGIDKVNISVSPPPTSVEGILELFRRAFAANTYRVVSVSHVTTTTGLRLPIAQIAALAHQHGAMLVVDGAQAHGGISVDVHSLGVDVYATSSHKWLCAPKGSGILYIAERVQPRIESTFLGGGLAPYTGNTGTRPVQTMVGQGAAIDYFERYGFGEIEEYNLGLRRHAYMALKAIENTTGIEIVSPADGPLAAPIITVGLPGNLTSAEVADSMFREHKTVLKVTGSAVFPEEGGPTMPKQAIRFTFHLFNDLVETQSMVQNFAAVVVDSIRRRPE